MYLQNEVSGLVHGASGLHLLYCNVISDIVVCSVQGN